MASALPEAAGIAKQRDLADLESVEVAWLGRRPSWFDGEIDSAALAGFSVSSSLTPNTRIVHLAPQAPETVAAVRRAYAGAAVVVDVGFVSSASSAALLDASGADAVLVESEQDVKEASRRAAQLEGKMTVAPSALDLAWHAPESVLTKLVGTHIKRFRRLHRLAHPSILFVGPYTRSGGLDTAIAATYRLREQIEDLRLAAIPLGAVDQKYLDQCDMDALALGHRGIIEWTCPPDDRRFWYATATVVCCPWRDPGEPPEAPVLAAAAARPFIGSDLPVFRNAFQAPDAPALVEPGDVDALVDSLAPLLADVTTASALGESARSAVEAVRSSRAAADRLASLWNSLARRPPLDEAA